MSRGADFGAEKGIMNSVLLGDFERDQIGCNASNHVFLKVTLRSYRGSYSSMLLRFLALGTSIAHHKIAPQPSMIASHCDIERRYHIFAMLDRPLKKN